MGSKKVEFWSRVNKAGETDCWLWTGPKFRTGYGCSGHGGQKAHRVAYESRFGPIPDGLHVCHTCDVKLCVNPAHLFVGTNADNMADRNRKGRTQRGERSGHAKLTEAQVREIRASYVRYHPGCMQGDLASKYGVSQHTVHAILHRWIWRHVD